ncbi:MAG: hypothetical protein JXR77_17450, partial [Lentisphaeria bacterium]|nr:hypothetical protein [Lentisphaeria bacterium]
MSTGIVVVVVVCVLAIVILYAMRGRAWLKGDIPKPVALGVLGVAVVAAGIILWSITMRSPRAAVEDAEADAAMMAAEPGTGRPGMGGGPGMGGPGMGEPNPRRDLGRFVRKMAALREQNEAAFPADQAARLVPLLKTLAEGDTMTVEAAEAHLTALQGILTEEQKAAVDAVELPRRGRGGGPGGGAGGGPGGPGGGAGGGAGG